MFIHVLAQQHKCQLKGQHQKHKHTKTKHKSKQNTTYNNNKTQKGTA
jgi:hypothetical protein